MTQYLVTTFEDSMGYVHLHVTAAKPNQTYTVVEAESKEEAEERYKDKKAWPNCESWNTVHEFVYENNEPVLIVFECINCKHAYTNYIKKG